MIKDKNIFECIFLDNQIWFPNYVVWGPPSHGHQRRKMIFKKAFPDLESSISSAFSWKSLRRRHDGKRRIFKYDDTTKVLNEIDKDSFFVTGFGQPIEVGERIITNNETFIIEKLSVVSHAGLIASYTLDNEEKKINVSFFERKSNNESWQIRKQK